MSFSRVAVAKYLKGGGWFKTTEIYSCFLEATHSKSQCQQGHAVAEGSGEGSFLASSSCRCSLAILGVLGWQLQHLSLCLHCHISLSLSLYQSLLFVRTPGVSDLGPTILWYDLLLTRSHLQRHYFQIRPPS